MISAPSLGVYYFFQFFLSLTLSVCLSQTLNLLFLFLDKIELFLGRQFSMTPSTKRCSSIFDLGPLMPKIYSPKSLVTDNATLPCRHPWSRSRHSSSDWWKSAIHWTSGLTQVTLVAMATTFGLGAEIQSPTGLFAGKIDKVRKSYDPATAPQNDISSYTNSGKPVHNIWTLCDYRYMYVISTGRNAGDGWKYRQ